VLSPLIGEPIRVCLCVLALLSCAFQERHDGAAARLVLTESWGISLPDSLKIVGARPDGAGNVLLWTDVPLRILLVSPAGMEQVPHTIPSNGRELLPVVGASSLRFLDPVSGRVLSARDTAESMSLDVLTESMSIQATAAAGPHLLVVGTRGDRWSIMVFDWETRGRVALHEVRDDVPEPSNSAQFLPTVGGLLLWFMRSPFTVFRVTADGNTEVFARVLEGLAGLDEGYRGDLAHWVALAFVPLDRGFLIQLADLTSDDRLLVVIDDDGNVVRSRTVQAAFGVLTSDAANRVLFTVRSLNRREIVAYRWHWEEAVDWHQTRLPS